VDANKGSVQNFFEDFRIGQEFECPPPRVLSDADRVAYISHTGDRTPRFCDSGGLIHPLIVLHTVLGQTVRQISLNAYANLGYAGMIWRTPVRVGDELRTCARIIGLKENSNGKSGIVYVQTTGKNQREETVLEYIRWVMVQKNRENATTYLREPVIPELPGPVTADTLPAHSPDPFPRTVGGGQFFFEDYSPGERIYHIDGMTVNSSDHMTFTRLYQNSARVHFDTLLTGGEPVVYGGLPMSIGYAQALNGFENRLGITAVNSGTHANPVHSGDTLYSFTDVLACSGRAGAYGALRLRLVVVKNDEPSASHPYAIELTAQQTGRKSYNANVVLDLDYWEIVPRRRVR
jgi:2-methylfumaryl-CoA hydratase